MARIKSHLLFVICIFVAMCALRVTTMAQAGAVPPQASTPAPADKVVAEYAPPLEKYQKAVAYSACLLYTSPSPRDS